MKLLTKFKKQIKIPLQNPECNFLITKGIFSDGYFPSKDP